MKNLIILFHFLILVSVAQGQITEQSWTIVSDGERGPDDIAFFNELPQKYITVELDCRSVFKDLREAKQTITLPNPEGRFEAYEIWPVEVVPEELKTEKSAKTYRGVKISDSRTIISFTIYDLGVWAAVYGPGDDYFIIPTDHGSDRSLVYYRKDELSAGAVHCLVDHSHIKEHRNQAGSQVRNTNIIEYDIAFSTAGEYSMEFGEDPYDANNVINATTAGLEMINPIFERDLGIRFKNVTPAALIFEDPETDPYNVSDLGQVIEANRLLLNGMTGLDYDLGHVLIWANTGGLAYVGVVCNGSYKAGAASGSPFSLSSLWIDVVSHEIGHQIGMRHNHSTSATSCNTTQNYRFEPGDGSSIMSYAGLCGNSYTSYTDPYFHISSIDTYNGLYFTCGESQDVLDNPTVYAGEDITIPKMTPFLLVGSGNAASYNWEQYDGSGPAVSGPPSSTCIDCANFKYEEPASSPVRYFPDYYNVLAGANNNVTWEKLSSVARTMNFKFVGRNPMGISADDAVVTVDSSGPLVLTAPNGGETFDSEESITVTWDVNNTYDIASKVDILLSTDNGDTFTIAIADTENDGAATIALPMTTTSEGRLLIRPHSTADFGTESTFYDITDGAFGIGTDPSLVPENDLKVNAIQGYQDVPIQGNLEHATPQSDVTYQCAGTLEKDLWYKYVVSEDVEPDEQFSLQIQFNSTGNYGIAVTLGTSTYCLTGSSTYNYGWILQGNNWANQVIYVRVFKYSNGLRPDGSNTRAPETFTITASGSALPVEFGTFTGERKGRNVDLAWTTLMEENVDRFEVLGSTDGKRFDHLGSVTATGRSTQEQNYTFTDKNGMHSFYKIRSVDLDGATDQTDVIYVPLEGVATGLDIYPNPSDGRLALMWPADGSRSDIFIYDTQGRVVHRESMTTHAGNNYFSIDVTELERGVYILQVMGTITYTDRIIIQ